MKLSRLETLQERLHDLKDLMTVELKLKQPSPRYVEDLELSIKEIEAKIKQLTYGRDNPVKMVG